MTLPRGVASFFRIRSALIVAGALLGLTQATEAHAGTSCPPATYVKGVDIFDGSGTLDWSSAASAGIGFGFAKASQGTYDTDSQFAANWANMKAAGVVRGAYHFLDPTESGVDQANFFLGIIGTLEPGDLPPMLDIECPTSNTEPDSDDCLGIGSSGDATGAAITQVMNDWLTTVKAATGRTPIIYSYGSYFSDDGIDTTGLENYPLYIAYPTTGACYDFPAPWTSAVFWQYDQNGTVAGIGGGTDLDYFIGDSSALSAFIASGTAPIPDAGDVDAGVPCTVPGTGDMGICMLTSTCATLPNGVSTPDLCPGESDIQCCTYTQVADAGVDATIGSGSGSSPGGSGSGTGAPTGSGSGTSVGSGTGGGGATGGTVDGGPTSRDGSVEGGTASEDETSPSSGGCTTSGRSGDAWGFAALGGLAFAVALRKRRRSAVR